MDDLSFYLHLPWTIESEPGEDGSVEITVAELPEFMVFGESGEQAEDRFWPALKTLLESYIADGQVPPLPENLRVRIDSVVAAARVRVGDAQHPAEIEEVSNASPIPTRVHELSAA